MWLAVAFLAALAGAVWIGVRYERQRLRAETAEQVAALKDTVRQVRATVAGMDDDELDALVHGPERVPSGNGGKQRSK